MTTEMKSAFAKRVGLSRGRISQLCTKGLPVTSDGLIDVGPALEWMSAHLDPTQRVAQRKVQERQPGMVPPIPDLDNDDGGDDLLAARTAHELIKVQRAQIALERERGDVAPWSEINRVLFEHGRRQRDSWLSWSQRVVPELAAELKVDGALLTATLRRVVSAHLAELSEAEKRADPV